MSNDPVRYAVRLSPRAERDLDRAVVDYADLTGDENRAALLYRRIRETAATLSENPDRYAVAEHESQQFGFSVRRVLARLSKGSGVAYHLIYFAVEESPDGPRVSIVHIRHASRAELTTEEASEIRAQQ
ncbi:MAG: type II toxin-antitoxin system RelE/ParE family toxin [Akkermansiaceae bacterium]|nr:type II toxin-antitoxin system RelE/ParE family toxin [Armatimonadota bacterium]